MTGTRVVVENWEGDAAIRIPGKLLLEISVCVGDDLHLIEEYVGTVRCVVLSKTSRIPDRIDDLFESSSLTESKDTPCRRL